MRIEYELRATLKAIEGMDLIPTGVPSSNICRMNSTTASSSKGVRYCWLSAFSSVDRWQLTDGRGHGGGRWSGAPHCDLRWHDMIWIRHWEGPALEPG
jgi:hypothetical protein